MNIYEFREYGEKTWVCGNTLIEALQYYSKETDLEITDFDSTDDIVLFPQEKWKDTYITYYEEDNLQISFEEFMKGQVSPEILASTAYN